MVQITRSTLPRIGQQFSLYSTSKKICIAFLCLFGVILILGGNHSKENKNSPSLRSTAKIPLEPKSTPTTVDRDDSQSKEESTTQDENVVDENAVQNAVTKAMSEMSNSVQQEFKVTVGWMHDAIVDAKTSIHRSMDYFLKDIGGYTDSEADEIDNEVAEEVEEKLKAALMEKVNKAVEEANADLNSLVTAEVNDKFATKEIEKDVETIRSYYVERLKAEIDTLENEMEGKIHSVSQDVEKKVLKEQLGLEETTKDLQDEEVKSIVSEKENEVFQAANDKAVELTKDVDAVKLNLETEIKKALKKFLVENKKLSESDEKDIEEKVVEGIEENVKSIVQEEIGTLEENANYNADEVKDVADEDLIVIKSAKELGMSTNDEDGDGSVSMIENSLEKVKAELDASFKELVKSSKIRVIQQLKDSTKDVAEKTVLNKESIEVSQEELDDLVAKATDKALKNLDDSADE